MVVEVVEVFDPEVVVRTHFEGVVVVVTASDLVAGVRIR